MEHTKWKIKLVLWYAVQVFTPCKVQYFKLQTLKTSCFSLILLLSIMNICDTVKVHIIRNIHFFITCTNEVSQH